MAATGIAIIAERRHFRGGMPGPSSVFNIMSPLYAVLPGLSLILPQLSILLNHNYDFQADRVLIRHPAN